MTVPTPRRPLVLAVLLALGLLLAMPAAGLATNTPPRFTEENKEAFEQQLAKHEIKSAEFNKRLRSLHITSVDGKLYLYHYEKKGAPAVESKLKGAHVHYAVLRPAAAEAEQKSLGGHKKHKIRYIIGGVALLLIVIGAIVYFVRRSRMRD